MYSTLIYEWVSSDMLVVKIKSIANKERIQIEIK
jgi:hypothetical protein